MSKLDHHAAAAAPAEFLHDYNRQFDDADPTAVRTAPEDSFEDNGFLIVPWNSVALLDHGDVEAELAGNPPIMVNLQSGACGFMAFDKVIEMRDRGFVL